MRVIPVDLYPLTQGYDSVEAAIEGAKRHPLQPQAAADTEKLSGSTLIDGSWTDAEFLFRFSNELLLRVYVSGQVVKWEVGRGLCDLDESAVERVGSPPVLCRWRPEVGDHV